MDCSCCCIVPTLFAVVLIVVGLDYLQRRAKAGSSLRGQHVMITGGSSGIGKEVAILAAKRGAHVTIVARDPKKLETAKNEIVQHIADKDQKVTSFVADVSNYDEVESMVQRAILEVDTVDILITSAGYSYPSKLEDIPMKHIKGMMDVNYFGTVNAVRAILPGMKTLRRGKIVCVSSIAGLTGLFGYTGYSASKFAVRGFAEALQMEVKPYNISVTLNFPPDTDTPALAEENKVKPLETKLIGETAGVFQPNLVAESLINDCMAGNFFSSTGFDGYLATIITAGMSPASNLLGVLLQTTFMGPLRLVSLGYLYYFNRIVSKCFNDREKQKRTE